jgi:hypothetical protein
MAYCKTLRLRYNSRVADCIQVLLLEPSSSACMQPRRISSTPQLNAPRSLHYHKIVENEYYVSHSILELPDHPDNA